MKYGGVIQVGKNLDFTNHSDNRMNCQCAGCNAIDKAIVKARKRKK